MSQRVIRNQRYYSEIAQRFGNLVRNNLISRGKQCKQQSLKILEILQSFRSPNQPKWLSNKKIIGIPLIYTANAYKQDKFYHTQQFKQKLKFNLDKNKINKQQRIYQLAKTIKFRRKNMLVNKQNKINRLESTKKQQASIMRHLLEKSKEEVNRNRRQIQLQQSFKRLERRLKSQQTENLVKQL